MAQTLREVIEQLSKLERFMDKPVVWAMFTEDDVETFIDDVETEDSSETVWAKIADEVQGDLDSEFINRNMSDFIYTNVGIHYDWKK